MKLLNKKDILLIVGVLVLAGGMFAVMFVMKKKGAEAVVKVNGTVYGTYRLYENQKINIDTKYGHNVLIIRDKKIYMEDADCPDKYCISQGKIDKSNQTIVCLPHKLVVEITATNDNQGDIDAVAK